MVKLNQVVCKLNFDEFISYIEVVFQLEIGEMIYYECVIGISRILMKEIREGNVVSIFRG